MKNPVDYRLTARHIIETWGWMDLETLQATLRVLKSKKKGPKPGTLAIDSENSAIDIATARLLLIERGVPSEEVVFELWGQGFELPIEMTAPFRIGRANKEPIWVEPPESFNDQVDEYYLCRKYVEAVQRIMELLARAEKGSEVAAKFCAEFGVKFTKRLNRVKLASPHAFQNACGDLECWPVLKSPHPHFSENERDLLRDIGSNSPFPMDTVARWNPEDPGTQIALALYKYVKRIRGLTPAFIKDPQAASVLPFRPEVQQAVELPVFNKASALQWWTVAEQFFRYTYSHPEENDELRVLGIPKQLSPREAKKLTPGILRRNILRNLKDKFVSLAGR